jgi:hypothetical protein
MLGYYREVNSCIWFSSILFSLTLHTLLYSVCRQQRPYNWPLPAYLFSFFFWKLIFVQFSWCPCYPMLSQYYAYMPTKWRILGLCLFNVTQNYLTFITTPIVMHVILLIRIKKIWPWQILLRVTFWNDTSFCSFYRLSVTLSWHVVQKNHNGAQMVMSQMQIAGVKPDSETFSYLIVNCESEEGISKVCHKPDHLLFCLCLYCGSWKGTALGSVGFYLSKKGLSLS